MAERIVDEHKIIGTEELVRMISALKGTTRYCFVLGSGASAGGTDNNRIRTGKELEYIWMEDLEKIPGFKELKRISEELKDDRTIEHDVSEIIAA